jgi:xanthine dehydrogenase iron-sulfur cluster and FAD-binding subunit A
MWNEYIVPATVMETLQLLDEKRDKARLVAGATDLMLELERGVRQGIETVIDITRLPNLDQITLDEDDTIHIGPLLTHNAAASSRLLRQNAFPLVSAAWQVGAPQIRNRATVAGNLVTASPANDTITPLMALGASVTLASRQNSRRVPLAEFYTGVRKTILQPDEMLIDIDFPALTKQKRGAFLKLGLRRAQAISLVNAAIILDLDSRIVKTVVITLGAVAPTIIRAPDAEAFLSGKELTEEVIAHAGDLAAEAARPIDDIRGSAAYRKAMVKTLVVRGLQQLRDGRWQTQIPESPVLLWGKQNVTLNQQSVSYPASIHTRINGKEYFFKTGYRKSLLRLLREEAGLTGTKEGCAEGECGACTVYMDGKAVMACLVPAPRADGSEIITIEGVASLSDKNGSSKGLHPVQEAFITNGAVQCGYCTPGFVMSAAKLLEENPHPSRDEITQALTGNLCRCTGYYKIIRAVEDATKM